MLFDVCTETCQQCVQTHFVLVAANRVILLAGYVLELDKGLKQLSVLTCELLTIRVLLDLTLTSEAFATGALEREHLVAQKEGVLKSFTLCARKLLLLLQLPHHLLLRRILARHACTWHLLLRLWWIAVILSLHIFHSLVY